jgi:hypothetical protein
MMTTAKRRGASMMMIAILLLNLSRDDVGGVVTAMNLQSMISPTDKEQQHTQNNNIEQQSSTLQRRLSSDHNFCGIGFQDASTSCQYPCPSGSIDECPHGMLCYFNTPCDIQNLDGQTPTNKPTRPQPTISPSNKPTGPTVAPTVGLMVDQPSNHQFCG